VEGVLADHPRPAPLHVPEFSPAEREALLECLESTYVSSVGPFVEDFAAALAKTCGTRFAVPVNTGTAALHLSLLACGAGPGDEVIIPALSFVATANAVAYTGATPHFADIATGTLGLCPEALAAHLDALGEPTPRGLRNRRTGRRIAAVVPMHAFGHPVDMPALLGVAGKYGLAVVEDAAESLGSELDGRPMGSFGLCAALSFNGNKIVTTGGGGAILTDDDALHRHVRHLSTTAKKPHPYLYEHDHVGFNYRLPNLNAALGLAQLARLPDFVRRKRLLARRYAEALSGVPGVRFAAEPAGTRSNYWLSCLLLESPPDEEAAAARDALIERLHASGILARPAWGLLNEQPMFALAPGMDLPVARRVEARLVSLPSSPCLAGTGREVST
jgi:perosamine synthetase